MRSGPEQHRRALPVAPIGAAGHDGPGPQDNGTAQRGPWPVRTESVRRKNGMVELRGTFTAADLQQLQRAVPARVITRGIGRILIWPPGTRSIEHHDRGLVLLRGYFEASDLAAVRTLHPEQVVTHAADQITIWPTSIDPARLENGGK
ncbi:hypothetical protein [Streptomyces sp. N35]|uniref:hypothetical protein n=1 Tax=Streptomyces sp. N35 TaxID=2795730 RepID=UPI0018F299DF|nr:hypothetical protein [Streptomyces sp. N35]